jgi:hypothetical protein
MAGHMSRKMQQHYIHISEAAKRKAVQRTYGGGTPVRSSLRGTSVAINEKKII